MVKESFTACGIWSQNVRIVLIKLPNTKHNLDVSPTHRRLSADLPSVMTPRDSHSVTQKISQTKLHLQQNTITSAEVEEVMDKLRNFEIGKESDEKWISRTLGSLAMPVS